jgi:hypothetical protein
MIEKYRLKYFDQLLKSETNKDFILLFGQPLKLIMKKFEIPITLLYSYRTGNELINIDQVHQIFRKSIAKILQNHIEDDEKLISNSQQSASKLVSLEHQSSSQNNSSLSHSKTPIIPIQCESNSDHPHHKSITTDSNVILNKEIVRIKLFLSS